MTCFLTFPLSPYYGGQSFRGNLASMNQRWGFFSLFLCFSLRMFLGYFILQDSWISSKWEWELWKLQMFMLLSSLAIPAIQQPSLCTSICNLFQILPFVEERSSSEGRTFSTCVGKDPHEPQEYQTSDCVKQYSSVLKNVKGMNAWEWLLIIRWSEN